MRLINVTRPIHAGMITFPGDPPVELRPVSSLAAGDDFSVSALCLGTHTGTHVDAPAHCFAGSTAVDALSLADLCGPAYVLDLAARLQGKHNIGVADLVEMPSDCRRLLLRTPQPAATADDPTAVAAPALDEAGTHLLIRRGIRLCGIDQLSIAPTSDPLPVHRLLLGAQIVILEGLELREAPAGACELICLPLLISGADGAPARVVLRYP